MQRETVNFPLNSIYHSMYNFNIGCCWTLPTTSIITGRDYLLPDQSLDPRGRRLAAIVMDAFTGEIKALPSWPYSDPSYDNFEEELQQVSPLTQMAMLRNHNLDSHVVGSTIKPLVFSALASAFWPDQDISQLVVSNIPDQVKSTSLGNGHMHDHIGGLLIGHAWDCDSPLNPIDSHSFLVNSSDYYENVLGIAGSVLDKHSWNFMLSSVPSRNATPVRYKGKSYFLDLAQIRESNYGKSLFTLDDIAFGQPRSFHRSSRTRRFCSKA